MAGHIHGPGCGHDAPDSPGATAPGATATVTLPDRAGDPVRVELTRGRMVESVHRVRAVVVAASGAVEAAWGDRLAPVYPRSANKALQALPLVETGAAAAFGVTDAELALAIASHRGEPMHTQRVAAWLARIGLGPDDLECGSHAPYHEDTAAALQRTGTAPTTLHNNCSGKHTGMLTTALHRGEPTRGYVDWQHPVQQRILGVLEQVSGQDLSGAPWGIDGCSIPTIGLPLEALAFAMARLADPVDLPAARAEAAGRIVRAWGLHPELVSGTDADDTVVMQTLGARILVKGGAEGVHTAVVPEAGLGVAVKVDDGGNRASGPALLAVLARVGLLTPAELDRLTARAAPAIANRRGLAVGETRTAVP